MQTFETRTAKRDELLSQASGRTPASGDRHPLKPCDEPSNVLLDAILGEGRSRPGLEPEERSICTKNLRAFDVADRNLYAPGRWLKPLRYPAN